MNVVFIDFYKSDPGNNTTKWFVSNQIYCQYQSLYIPYNNWSIKVIIQYGYQSIYTGRIPTTSNCILRIF